MTATAVLDTKFGRIRVRVSGAEVVGLGWTSDAPCRDDAHPVLDRAVAELEGFAAGSLRSFSVPVSLEGVAGFYRDVLETLHREVPFGETVTYGQLAKLVGRPGAARAVGTAMNKNPVPILVPCHRVLASGGIGGFGPGVEKKRRLLAHEGVRC